VIQESEDLPDRSQQALRTRENLAGKTYLHSQGERGGFLLPSPTAERDNEKGGEDDGRITKREERR